MIPYEDFQKLEIKIGKIKTAEKVPDTDKLIRLSVDTGEERQLVAGIAEFYSPEELVGKSIVVLTNLEPKKFKGLESQGMLLAADMDGKPILLQPEKDVPSGTKVR